MFYFAILVIFVTLFWSHMSLKRMRDAVKNIPGPINLPIIGAVYYYVAFNPQILIVIFVALIFKHLSLKRMRDAVKKIPGPLNLPFVGALHHFMQFNPQNVLEKGYITALKYQSRIIKGWVFNRLIIACADHEINDQLLASQVHITKHGIYKILRQWLGFGLLVSDGKKWFARRRIITPTFHFKILEEFVEVFDQQSSILVKRLAKKADGKTTFDVRPFICVAALDIIAETAMGTKVYAQSDTSTPYAIAVNRITKLLAFRFMKVHLNNELIFTLMYPHLKYRQMKYIKTMHDFTKKVITERRQALEKELKGESANDESDIGAKKRMALLDVLLQSTIDGKPLSDEDIREEVDTFMFEGHDTTTSALSFALHTIARFPSVQHRMLDEVLRVFGSDRNRLITLRDLNELKYTECVIKETLRMYPSVPIIARQIQEDFKYSHSILGEGFIPAGTEFIISIFSMMRDPERFESPEAFQPERHENNEKIAPYSLIPFSAGPRNCIGQKFAMLEMKMVLAKVIRDYELLPLGEPVKLEVNVVLQSLTGHQLGMRRRT